MNVYEEIDQETMMLLLDSLCKRTVEGKRYGKIWSIILFPFYRKIFMKKKVPVYHKCLKQRQCSITLNMN